MTNKKHILKIDTGRWLRASPKGGLDLNARIGPDGNYPKGKTGESSLLDGHTNRMCCLGFAAVDAGVPQDHILEVRDPANIRNKESRHKIFQKYSWLFSDNTYRNISKDTADLISANDSSRITLSKKKRIIKRIFAKNGVDIIFAGPKK